MKKLLLILLCITGLLFLAKFIPFIRSQRALASLVEKTDSIIVCDPELIYLAQQNDSIKKSHPNGQLFLVNKPKDVAFFKQHMVVAFDQDLLPISCRCGGEYILVFMSGKTPLAKVGFAHKSHLKQVPNHRSDLFLKGADAKDLARWIQERIPPHLDAEKKRARATLEELPAD